jgi:cell division transport system permease protein
MSARRPRGGRYVGVQASLRTHRRALAEATRYLRGNPLASALGVAVMAVALALPALFDVLLVNQRALLARWHEEPAITLFLDPLVDVATARDLAGELAREPGVARVDFVPAATALAEFRAAVGLSGEALPADNPLPHLLEVRPLPEVWASDRGAALTARLGGLGEVDQVLVEHDWLDRLAALAALAERVVALLAVVLGSATVLVVANTIRSLVQLQADTIAVMKLVGATDGYVRRPFLYCGAMHGVLAGALALGMTAASCSVLAGPVATVAAAYGSDYRLAGLPALHAGVLALGAILCGWSGAFLGTALSLRRLEPGAGW